MNIKQQQAVVAFRKACNDLAQAVNEQLFDGDRSFYWVGGEVGGACDFDDIDVLNPEDMVLIIENGLDYDHYAEWRNANLDHDKYINLKSWLMGCRHDMLTNNEDDGKEKDTHS